MTNTRQNRTNGNPKHRARVARLLFRALLSARAETRTAHAQWWVALAARVAMVDGRALAVECARAGF